MLFSSTAAVRTAAGERRELERETKKCVEGSRMLSGTLIDPSRQMDPQSYSIQVRKGARGIDPDQFVSKPGREGQRGASTSPDETDRSH